MVCRPELMGTGGSGLYTACFLASKDECTLLIRTRWERHNAAPNTSRFLCGSLHYLILMGSAATSQFIKHSPCVNTGYLSGGVTLSSSESCRNRTEHILWTKTWMADLSVRIYATTLSWSVLMPNHPFEGTTLHLVTFNQPVFSAIFQGWKVLQLCWRFFQTFVDGYETRQRVNHPLSPTTRRDNVLNPAEASLTTF